jgi:hypothetical protein
VTYTASGHTLCTLTNDAERVRACLRQPGGSVGSAIDAGIDEGLRVLVLGRPREPAPSLREVLVVYAALGNAAGCSPVIIAANRAKSQKVLVVSNCAGASCDSACMRQVASSARYFYDVTNGGRGLNPSRDLAPATVRRLTIVDRLPSDMAYVADSAQPAPDKGDPVSGLVWQMNYVPADGVTITFRVRPLELGRRPTNLEASGEVEDSDRAIRSFVFPVPMVDVVAEPTGDTPVPSTTPTASNTPNPCASGWGPACTTTPTRTDTPTPGGVTCTPPPCPCGRLVGVCPGLSCEACTATPTPRPGEAYLPWASCTR